MLAFLLVTQCFCIFICHRILWSKQRSNNIPIFYYVLGEKLKNILLSVTHKFWDGAYVFNDQLPRQKSGYLGTQKWFFFFNHSIVVNWLPNWSQETSLTLVWSSGEAVLGPNFAYQADCSFAIVWNRRCRTTWIPNTKTWTLLSISPANRAVFFSVTSCYSSSYSRISRDHRAMG